jgi:hypothetical protein
MLVALTACQTVFNTTVESIRGSGNLITASRSVSGFSSIQVNLGAELVLTQGNGESLSMEADDNLMPYILTDVHNGKLIVSTPNNMSITPSKVIRLSVAFKTLAGIEIFGSSDITATNLDLDTLSINFSGSGSTHLSGQVDTQNITIQGQATLRNFDLSSRNVTANISGNGTLEVNATDTLGVTVAGIGNIHYIGNPSITKNIMGAASITPR